jgi:lysophospholipase L1-like esterase
VFERCILLGDSIQSLVIEQTGQPDALAKELTAILIPSLTDVSIQNISSPGLCMADPAGSPGIGANSLRQAIPLISGTVLHATRVIVTLGVNDWYSPSTTGAAFTTAYQSYVAYCKSLGLSVVCVAPIFNFAEGNYITHTDGGMWLQNIREWIASIATLQGCPFLNGADCAITCDATCYASDGIHLNTKGHSLFAPWLVAEMKALGLWC